MTTEGPVHATDSPRGILTYDRLRGKQPTPQICPACRRSADLLVTPHDGQPPVCPDCADGGTR